MPRPGQRTAQLRRRLHDVLEHGPAGGASGRLVSRLIVLLICLNLVAVALESVPAVEARYAA
ncbi:MAG TPA: hypothetical protein VK281_17830 [Xanthobacteraceae bacterium]|nr:hypothetical protein [Xanthobacteraceae bacterium]